MRKHAMSVRVAILGLLFCVGLPWCASLPEARAASVSLSHSVEESGAVPITAQGSFASCRYCDSNGENCRTVDTGSVSLHGHCGDSGHGSASCTSIRDRGGLHGSHTFTGSASDCEGSATDSLTITLDNTPSVTLTSPKGTVEGAFDISGMVQFKPTLSNTKGTIHVYFDNNSWSYQKTCMETDCSFSYLEDKGKLYDLSHGEHKITVKAVGGGATNNYVENFTVDNMPEVNLASPKGMVHGAFDIAGIVHFKPSSTGKHGTIYVYFDNNSWSYQKTCMETDCSFSYLEDKEKLYNLSHGEHKITVKAVGGGATNNYVENFTVDNMPAITLVKPLGGVEKYPLIAQGTVSFQPVSGSPKGTITIYIDNGYRYTKRCDELSCDFETTLAMSDSTAEKIHVLKVRATSGGATAE